MAVPFFKTNHEKMTVKKRLGKFCRIGVNINNSKQAKQQQQKNLFIFCFSFTGGEFYLAAIHQSYLASIVKSDTKTA